MRALVSFPAKLLGGFLHRIWWRYFIYDVNIVSVLLTVGLFLIRRWERVRRMALERECAGGGEPERGDRGAGRCCR